ncbi:ABC transporter ATP-binding protein [Amycolatopsis pithecellobii]|uniref:ATP-binding cassette domain-containing protein n=1 Tax=Amycolatopsis pithecellobii TaxID=664692 RepID=A0A6N7Z802_9PSEU|nr:ABC transporter ATP-binding protein [Amycolatopsis pithecellobii]MTD57591.1 ATP-binding cassette domain-containing protein [Amycolatopsis pithecellobii]
MTTSELAAPVGTTRLEVSDLSVSFPVRGLPLRSKANVRAVDHVGFTLDRGETLGLVGESGSGKSTTARAIMRLVKPEAGRVVLNGTEISALSDRRFRGYRRGVQMVFQDPFSSLDPSMTIETIITEPLRVHTDSGRRARSDRAAELMRLVGLNPAFLDRYPYEFSGGQRQRIAIARAIAVEPDVLICDEAVSALDVSTQNQIVALLETLQRRLEMSYLFISHDLAVVRHIADRIIVMYLGRIVEESPTERLFAAPAHPYTQALLSAVPVPEPRAQRHRERVILGGDIPDPRHVPAGCRFNTRCPRVMDICRNVEPAPVPVAGGGSAACHLLTTPES